MSTHLFDFIASWCNGSTQHFDCCSLCSNHKEATNIIYNMFGVSTNKEPIKGKYAKRVREDLMRMQEAQNSGKGLKFKIPTKRNIKIVNKDKVREYLIHLDKLGWSELIDSRWKDDITNIIKEYDPSVVQEDLDELYKIILI